MRNFIHMITFGLFCEHDFIVFGLKEDKYVCLCQGCGKETLKNQ